MTLLLFLSWLLLGGITAYYAKGRGRRPIIWFFVGLFFGIFGLIFLFILPIVHEAPECKKEVCSPAPPTSNNPLLFWYYLDEANKQHGPLSALAFEEARKEGTITARNYVWNTEMENWKRLEEI
jgi:uncharacterized protein DUF4339